MQPTSPNDDPAAALLEQAINALKAGDSARARDLLAQAIQQNPTDDRAWLWLSGAVTTDADRRRCLERALALNPRNQAARRGLALLSSAPAPPAQASAPVPASADQETARTAPASPPPSAAPPASRTEPLAFNLASLRPVPGQRRLPPRSLALIALVVLAVIVGGAALARSFFGSSATPQEALAPTVATPTTGVTRTPTVARPTPT
ncbi:MAG TPA: hypothetical protein VF909_04830, partial [Roseiflexaceae bacterium]